eukprot:TRINITY_DN3688_c0_g1_i5.p1 TRINITY_DN3688_c0_g1~~TRINITY_DN3688_c0_g1_i5.p1  ORF type:complete len:122 (-),score=16.66 TRINITY_DN3688_c0_g1_i5:1525-1890(-)
MVDFSGMDRERARASVHIHQRTCEKYYLRELVAPLDPLRELPEQPVFSDFILRRFYKDKTYLDEGVVLDPVDAVTHFPSSDEEPEVVESEPHWSGVQDRPQQLESDQDAVMLSDSDDHSAC